MDSVVVLSSMRMTYLGDDADSMMSAAAEDTNSEVTRGIFWIVPRTGELLWVIVTHVPGGKGSRTESVQFRIRPQVQPSL